MNSIQKTEKISDLDTDEIFQNDDTHKVQDLL
jgi:hypothetical protein